MCRNEEEKGDPCVQGLAATSLTSTRLVKDCRGEHALSLKEGHEPTWPAYHAEANLSSGPGEPVL